jgi:micrococcal nuclease
MTRRRATITSVLITAIVSTLLYAGQIYFTQHPVASPWLSQPNQTEGTPVTPVAPGFYRVVKVVDGDTIVVDMNGTEETVRFIGVDTPETHKPNTPVQCFGPDASDFTHRILDGKTVRLEADPTNDNRDRYGRLLRYVYAENGTLLEQAIIEQGFGFAYTSFPFQKKEAFIQAQTDARAQAKGLWAACKPFQQADGRWQTPTQ